MTTASRPHGSSTTTHGSAGVSNTVDITSAIEGGKRYEIHLRRQRRRQNRAAEAKRQYGGGQAREMGLKDREVCIGLITRWMNKPTPTKDQYQQYLHKFQQQLINIIRQGIDIVIPAQTEEKAHRHNLGTNRAKLPMGHKLLIQQMLDQVSQYAAATFEISYWDGTPPHPPSQHSSNASTADDAAQPAANGQTHKCALCHTSVTITNGLLAQPGIGAYITQYVCEKCTATHKKQMEEQERRPEETTAQEIYHRV